MQNKALVFVLCCLMATCASTVEVEQPNAFAVFFTGLKCNLKTYPAANLFYLDHAQDYPDLVVQEVTSGNPRIKIFKTAEDRDASTIDASQLSVEEIQKMLTEGPKKVEHTAYIDVNLMTLEEIHAALKKHNVFRTFPRTLFY
mmetsp:Transcript_37078/g.72833  ORF Transcript_37078/g.72833 Transcript_37078/m.72833 type:complete len:143 (+) Transcript_37078:29-457(+)|eukprot:CAMPEP_0175129716 /NCGR_PEP_ID=MMETSP0087-20121206/5622_1 /TAXON_ID=136419 /ORGANISM="Unknown Unknown, Strain D1" /LENGTH=142 /DNA_ID=CAMNT_0016411887 /DNA_START=29 /DNA_END=457 /DNA_ORIENTATION=-